VSPLAARLHAVLPQTQCTRCGYPDCAGYAQAIADGEASINQCPPGGADGIARLAALTGQAALPLNPVHGVEAPRTVAVIDESWCIGCTLCIAACPTDAIMGAHKFMHTVIERYCTGCELCVPVCPVDCISLENVTGNRTGWQAWSPAQAAEALERYESRRRRLATEAPGRAGGLEGETSPTELSGLSRGIDEAAEGERKRSVIEAALARARARKDKPA
jgi:Na+-translocating ferredoxin:NAD+ oxidoreductase subunit B